MKVTKRQLRSIIKEEKRKLIRESLAETMPYEKIMQNAANTIVDKFYDDMMTLFDETPEAFEGRADKLEWEEQVVYAGQEIDTAVVSAMNDALQRIEAALHDGEYDYGDRSTADFRR